MESSGAGGEGVPEDLLIISGVESENTSDVNYTSLFDGQDYVTPFSIPHIRFIFIVLYVLVFVCCFFGNLFVILVVLRHRKMRTITNFFLANLAVADLCVGIFCVLPNLSTQLEPVWRLGKVMCKLYYFVQSMSYTASIMILTAISIERYFAIIHPMRSKQMTTLCMLRVIVLVIWTVAAGYAVPYLIKYETVDIGTKTFCLPMGNIDDRLYVTISFVLWYVIPLILMIIMYTKISIVLWKTSRPNSLEKNGFKNKKNRPKRKRHVRWMAFARGKASEIKDQGFRKPGLKPVIYVSGVTTSASSDEATTDEARHGQYVPCVAGDKPFLQATSSGYDSTTEGSVIEEVPEQSSDEAADYEDDWPTSNNKKRLEEYQMKQVYTFRNPTYNGACPSCQSPNIPEQNQSEEKAKCTCNNKAPNYSAPVVATRAAAITGRALKNRIVSRKTENALMARRRVIRLLIAVIISFALCVIPYYIRLLWSEWCEPTFGFFQKLVPPITFLIYYFNSGLNPILYAFLSDNFRRSLKEVLCCTVDENSRKRSMRTTMSVKTSHSTI